jgi:hypothetical protein
MVGFSEAQKIHAISKVFADSSKSPMSVVVVDNIERLLGEWLGPSRDGSGCDRVNRLDARGPTFFKRGVTNTHGAHGEATPKGKLNRQNGNGPISSNFRTIAPYRAVVFSSSPHPRFAQC